jgi:hypothetical protein
MFHQVGRFGTFPGYLLPLSLVLDTVPPGSGGQGLKPAVLVCAACFLPVARLLLLDVRNGILHAQNLDKPTSETLVSFQGCACPDARCATRSWMCASKFDAQGVKSSGFSAVLRWGGKCIAV